MKNCASFIQFSYLQLLISSVYSRMQTIWSCDKTCWNTTSLQRNRLVDQYFKQLNMLVVRRCDLCKMWNCLITYRDSFDDIYAYRITSHHITSFVACSKYRLQTIWFLSTNEIVSYGAKHINIQLYLPSPNSPYILILNSILVCIDFLDKYDRISKNMVLDWN